MLKPTDFILIQASLENTFVPAFASGAAQFCAKSPMPMHLHRVAWAAETQTAYVYCQLSERTHLDESALPGLAALFQRECQGAADVRVSRLERVFDVPGYSSSEPAVFHYVVEMDPEQGWMPEISRWYDIEHMPGLAAVPGCIRAVRMLNHDHGPMSLAYYDLVSTQTLGSAPWLAIRGTAWSDITRPHFTNTKRTMFVVLA